ncbi:MAG: Spy/CpxP family protein refolding chaperone, partial [Rubrivivax sp.]
KESTMKTWIKRTLVGLFGATLLVGGITACGHRHHGSEMTQWSSEDAAKWRERVVERAGKDLQLDDAQKARLGTLFDTLREQRNQVVGSTTNPRTEVLAMVSGAQFDKARAQALIDEKTSAIRAASPQTIDAMAAFYDSLNTVQQQKLRDFMGKRGHGWRS